MINNMFQKLSKALALALAMTTAITSAGLGSAAPSTATEAAINRNITQADVGAMVEKAKVLGFEGKYAEAVLIWEKLLAINENLLGPDHRDVVQVLNNLANLLIIQGQHNAAEAVARRSLEINERVFGPENREVAASLQILAQIFNGQGRFESGEPYLRRSLNILEKTLGPNHQDVAATLNDLAVLMMSQAKHAPAEQLLSRALMIREKILGPNHHEVAAVLHNQAMNMSLLADYSKTEQLYRRALAILEKTFGSDDIRVAQTLNNLALIIGPVNGQYSEAELVINRALAIRKEKLGSKHPLFAQSLSSLAEILDNQGKYAASEQSLRQVLAIREEILGTSHVEVGYSLNNLAYILIRQGRYSAAEPLIRRALVNLEKNLGQIHPYVAQSMINLASVLALLDQHDPAELLLERALIINKNVYGPNHLAVAVNQQRQAILLASQGKHSAAEHLFRRNLAIAERTLGPYHQYVGSSLSNLSVSLWQQGKNSEAEYFLRRSLAILEKNQNLDNLTYAQTLRNLAELRSSNNDFDGAISAMARSLAIESTWLLRELPLLPDQARSDQLRSLDGWQNLFNWADRHPKAVNLALETRLNRQGLLPLIEYLQALLLNSPDVDRAKVGQLQVLTQRLASVSLPPEHRTLVREQRDKLQAEIYSQIPNLQIQLVTPAQVAKALPADGALVEFQRFRPYDARKPIDQRWGAAQYIALVLKPDGSIRAVPLGAASEVDAQVHKGLNASASGFSDAEPIWAQLSTQILRPLLPHLKDSRQWFLSPDGELNRVPFAALSSPQQTNTPLGQVVQLRLLTTGRELLRLKERSASSGKAVVMANPSYDRHTAALMSPSTVDTSFDKGQRRSAELSSKKWKSLSGSEREGLQVAQLLNSQLISGTDATTTSLTRQQGPRVLHVATHGFFVGDQESLPNDPLRVLQEENSQLQGLRQEDPQLRSGLVLSGANQPATDPNDDGYLTAAEAVTLNLKGTELVVLSACSTGQGEVKTGEGVYGLQRSLTVAGARSTLLSLWKVDDAATAAFMTSFYMRLKAGEGRSDALAAVQKEFREGPIPAWRHPYYWAAWQLVGDWGPINGL